MKRSFVKLHIAVILAGFTAVFGKLIHLDEFVLVWYRMLMVAVILLVGLLTIKKLRKISGRDFWRVFMIGAIISVHWVAFYGSIMKSNISVGVVCFSLCGFFSSILEPFILKKKFSVRELLLGIIAVVGLLLIFSLDTRYRLGIVFGVVSAFLASLFTIFNKKHNAISTAPNMLLYEMVSGLLVLTLLIPGYQYIFPSVTFCATTVDYTWLAVLALFCTVVPWIFQIQCLKSISAFTVNLTYNLEPIYSILLALIFFGEARELDFSFYAGFAIIVFSVALQSVLSLVSQKRNPPS